MTKKPLNPNCSNMNFINETMKDIVEYVGFDRNTPLNDPKLNANPKIKEELTQELFDSFMLKRCKKSNISESDCKACSKHWYNKLKRLDQKHKEKEQSKTK